MNRAPSGGVPDQSASLRQTDAIPWAGVKQIDAVAVRSLERTESVVVSDLAIQIS